MTQLKFFDRVTQSVQEEQIYGGLFLKWMYGTSTGSRLIQAWVRPWLTRSPLFSTVYGWFQKSGLSRWKVNRFIRAFNIYTSEFLEPVERFRSFNDFFIRRLKKECRPLMRGEKQAILPADARYLVFPRID